jgi:hypothetical protein
MDWVLLTVGKKWKDFKGELKKAYFNENLTNEQLKKKYGDRVNDSDWEYLINHWTSPEFEVRLVDIKFLLYACETCIHLFLHNLIICHLGSPRNCQSESCQVGHTSYIRHQELCSC